MNFYERKDLEDFCAFMDRRAEKAVEQARYVRSIRSHAAQNWDPARFGLFSVNFVGDLRELAQEWYAEERGGTFT